MTEVCEVRWCRSGQPVTHHLTENLGDAAYRFGLCHTCWEACGMPREESEHTDDQQAELRSYWRQPRDYRSTT